MYECLQSEITENIWVPTKETVEFNNYDEFRRPYWEFYMDYYED